MKKFKYISYLVLVIVLFVLTLTAYTSASQNNEDDEKEKVVAEIKYLDTKLVDLFNNMNNIQTRNYKLYTTQIEESKSSEPSGSKEGENSSLSDAASSDTNFSSGSDTASGSNMDSSAGQNSTESKEDSEQEQSENIDEKYEMKASGILTTNRDIDWDLCKSETELIYTSIATITLDLYRSNVAQEDILNFNKDLDNLIVSLEEENKQLTLENLVKMYEYIPKFANVVMDDKIFKVIVETKLNVFRGYSSLDNSDWEKIKNNMIDAVNIYTNLLSNTDIDASKQISINNGYVMLNELKNAIDTQNISVFLIKYKNLLEEINNL